MNYTIKLVSCFSLIFLFVQCKNESTPIKSSDDHMEVVIPEEFVSFYNRFHSDSLFQMNHIVFPLAQKNETQKWEKENWKMHKAFNDQNGNYIREFDVYNGLIIETITERTGALKIVKRYSKSDSTYNLIYYNVKSYLAGWTKE